MAKARPRRPWPRSCWLPDCAPGSTPRRTWCASTSGFGLNGKEIGDDDFMLIHELVDRMAERLVSEGELPWHPSFFEMLTAIAFEYFARSRTDMAVLEVGMGGRLDATNVVEPLVSVITDISLDHQKFLGDTVAEIAREKAGIIRPGGIVVTLPQQPQANDVIGNTILERARAVSAAPYVPPVSPASDTRAGQVSGVRCQVSGIPGSSPALSARGLGDDYSGRFAADWAASVAQRRAGVGGCGGAAGTGASRLHPSRLSAGFARPIGRVGSRLCAPRADDRSSYWTWRTTRREPGRCGRRSLRFMATGRSRWCSACCAIRRSPRSRRFCSRLPST